MITLILNAIAIISIVLLLKYKYKHKYIFVFSLACFIGLSASLHIIIRNNPLKFYISNPGELISTTVEDIVYAKDKTNILFIKLKTGETVSFENKTNVFCFNEQYYSEDMIAYRLENNLVLKNKIYSIIAGVPKSQKSVCLEIKIPANTNKHTS